MNTLREYINKELAAGRSLDELAQDFTTLLNEAAEDIRQRNARADYIENCYSRICNNLDTSDEDWETVGLLAAMVYARKFNGTVEQWNNVAKMVENYCGGLDYAIGKKRAVETITVKNELKPSDVDDVIKRFLRANGVS